MMAFLSRKWRRAAALALGLAAALGVYALAGFLLVPYAAQAWLWPWLSQELGGRFQAGGVAFDPFALSAAVTGFSLRGPDGAELASVGEVFADVDVAASLANGALVGAGRISKPSASLVLDAQGGANYDFLIPKSEAGAPPSRPFPFLLTALRLEGGRLAFEDRSRGNGFKAVLSSLSLGVDNLGPATPARLTLDARTESGEALALEGGFRLDTLAFDGAARVQALDVAPLAAWLAEGLPYAAAGSLSASLKYRYSPESGFEVSADEVQARQLGLARDGQPFLEAGSLSVSGLSLEPKTYRVQARSLALEAFSLHGPARVAVASARASSLGFALGEERVEVQELALEQPALRGPVSASAGSAKARGLVFQLRENRLALESVEAAGLQAERDGQALAAVGGLAARALSYGLDEGRLGLEALRLDAVELKTPSPLKDREGNPRQHRVDALALGGLDVDLAKQAVAVGLVQSDHAVLGAWLEKDGSPGFVGLPKLPAAPAEGPPAPPGPPWRVRLGRVELNDNHIALRDFRFDPPASLRLSPLNLLVKDFDSASGQPFWLGMNTGLSANGRIALEGKARLSPATANLKLYVDDLSLPPFQPYLDQAVRFRVVKGRLNTNADIDYEEGAEHALRMVGDVAVADFASDDKREGRDFVNWKNLRLNGLVFESDGTHRLSIKEVVATEPYARAWIDADKKFNLAENFTPPAGAEPAPQPAKPAKPAQAKKPATKKPADEPAAVVVGTLHIHDGSMDFADHTIKPFEFAVGIHGLNGDIRSLSSRPGAKSDVLLEGRLGEGSAVRIAGKINPFSLQAFTDIAMKFSDVNLTTLSPYAAKFAGYRIEKGKLSMDLRYKLDNGQLTAENQFVLDHLDLGERVDSPEATSLPVRLAVSLLKDADGRIDVNLPLSGDLGNPEVSLRGLLAAAAAELVSKTVAAPFTLLGKLAGDGGEELGAVAFAPGAATLDGAEKGKLAVVAKALAQRPGLNLDIKGVAVPGRDAPALAEQDLARQLRNAKQIELGRRRGQRAEWDGTSLSEEDYGRLLTKLYRWKNPAAPELQGLPAGAALSGGQLEAARRRLLGQWKVGEADLRALARARAEAVRNHLVKELGLPDQRIYLLEVKLGGGEGKEIKALLSLSGS